MCRHHLASAWRLLLVDEMNALDGLAPEQLTEVRQTIVHVILGTDMKFHFDHLTKFKTRNSAGALDAPDKKDVRLMLAMCLHSADVANPAKPWALSREWSARVMDEFFRQARELARSRDDLATTSRRPRDDPARGPHPRPAPLALCPERPPCASLCVPPAQGDTESSKGLPISPFMDREKTDMAKCQVGFIK